MVDHVGIDELLLLTKAILILRVAKLPAGLDSPPERQQPPRLSSGDAFVRFGVEGVYAVTFQQRTVRPLPNIEGLS